jgi:hypothetical protein
MNANYQGTPTSESEDCPFNDEGWGFILVTFLLFHYDLPSS